MVADIIAGGAYFAVPPVPADKHGRIGQESVRARAVRILHSPFAADQGKASQTKGVESVMSLVRLLGFTTLACGCVVGRYREVATSREVIYVEEKGKMCGSQGHRRNHTVATERLASAASPVALASKAS